MREVIEMAKLLISLFRDRHIFWMRS